MNAGLQIFNQYSLSAAIYSGKLNKITIMFNFENEKMQEYQRFFKIEYYSLPKTAENPRQTDNISDNYLIVFPFSSVNLTAIFTSPAVTNSCLSVYPPFRFCLSRNMAIAWLLGFCSPHSAREEAHSDSIFLIAELRSLNPFISSSVMPSTFKLQAL